MEFKHGGEDTKNWAGHFGVKMTMSGVFVGQKRKKRAKRVRRFLFSYNSGQLLYLSMDIQAWYNDVALKTCYGSYT